MRYNDDLPIAFAALGGTARVGIGVGTQSEVITSPLAFVCKQRVTELLEPPIALYEDGEYDNDDEYDR